MSTRYRYHTPDGGAPNNGIPPGLEPPQGAMFGPQYSFGGSSAFGPPQFGSSLYGPTPFGAPQFGPQLFGPAPGGVGPMIFFPTQAPPPPPPPGGVGPTVCFPTSQVPSPSPPPPPQYTQNPYGTPMPVGRPSVPTLANERPAPGASVNGQIAKFGNRQGHIHSKNNTTFHLVLDGAKPWNWGAGGSHRFTVCTASSSMPIEEFIEQVGALKQAPHGTPREMIGLQEAIEEGDGQFRAGPAFRLGDPKIAYETDNGTLAYKTLEQLGWSSNRGEVGRGKPVTIAFLP